MAINVLEEVPTAQTLEQLEEVIEKYKKSNPEKHALKVANGDFDRQRALLGGKPVATHPKPEKPAKNN